MTIFVNFLTLIKCQFAQRVTYNSQIVGAFVIVAGACDRGHNNQHTGTDRGKQHDDVFGPVLQHFLFLLLCSLSPTPSTFPVWIPSPHLNRGLGVRLRGLWRGLRIDRTLTRLRKKYQNITESGSLMGLVTS